MLDTLRQFAGGYVAKILIGLLILSFGVWGISGSLLFDNTFTVVEVGKTKVDANEYRLAYENQLSRLSQQIQRRLSREEANAFGLENSVMAQLVSGAVLDENGRKMGLGLSEDNLVKLIASDPNFTDAAGNFSRSTLELTLRQIGMREEDYITNRKKLALRNQIIDGTAASLESTKAFTDAFSLYQNEKRDFEYVIIGDETLGEIPAPTSAELQTYYDENKNTYRAPEYRKLRIVKLEAEDISKPEDVSEEDLVEAYEAGKSSFITAEKRRIQQLVLKDSEEAQAIKAKLDAGASFESIVEELGKTLSDVDLGLFEKSQLPDAGVADAAFSLELNKTSDIVDGLFGPVIVRVPEISPEVTTPFEEVKEQLRTELALSKATEDIFDAHDRIEDERAAGDTLSESARKIGLTATVIDAIDATGLDKEGNVVNAVPNIRTVLAQAFDTGVDVEADPVDIGSNGYVWFEVIDVISDRQKPLDEVKSDVEQAWIAQNKSSQVKEIADSIAERVRGGEDFNTVLQDALPTDSLGQSIKVSTSGLVTRNANATELNREAVRAGFNTAKGNLEVVPATESGKHIVLRVAVTDASDSAPVNSTVLNQLNEAASQDILSQLVEDLQAREEVLINRSAIEAALGYGQQQHY